MGKYSSFSAHVYTSGVTSEEVFFSRIESSNFKRERARERNFRHIVRREFLWKTRVLFRENIRKTLKVFSSLTHPYFFLFHSEEVPIGDFAT